jgi:hypothetical protein
MSAFDSEPSLLFDNYLQARRRLKHPFRSDFHTVVAEAGVSVTFKPTNNVHSF